MDYVKKWGNCKWSGTAPQNDSYGEAEQQNRKGKNCPRTQPHNESPFQELDGGTMFFFPSNRAKECGRAVIISF